MAPGTRLELLTMCDLGFLPQALVLQRSIERHSQSVRLRVLCLDAATERVLATASLNRVELLSLAELEESDRELAAVKRDRTRREYCWTATPAFCRLALDRAGEGDVVLWVDADLQFLRDPHTLLDDLGDGSILVTPHEYYRTYSTAAPASYLTESWGRFNGGTVAFRCDEQGRSAAALWRSRSIEWCHDRLEAGRYGNQKHLVDFPERFSGARVLRVPGGGLGPWNAARYRIESDGKGIVAEGLPVTFYHHQSLRLYRIPPHLRPLPLPSNIFRLPGGAVGRINPRYRISPAERRLIWRPYVDRLAEATADVIQLANGSDSHRQAEVIKLGLLLRDTGRRLQLWTDLITHGFRSTRRSRDSAPSAGAEARQPTRTSTAMKVTALSMVRNEGDVIEAFVRHHAEIVDELVVIDHGSADGTGEILAALAEEGLPVRVRAEGSLVHRQNLVLTQLMREAATVGGADWVVPLDADEFLIAPNGGVREALAGLPRERPCTVDSLLYVPTPDDPEDEPNVLRRIRWRRELEGGIWTRKVVVPTGWARNDHVSLAQGNHGLLKGGTREFVPSSLTNELLLAHFPVRSERQLARKVLGGWPAHVARPDRAPDGAFQWKRAFDVVVAGDELTARQFEALAFDYSTEEPDGDSGSELILDPIPADFDLRYRARRDPTPLETLAETAVRLAEELSDALRDPISVPRDSDRS
jgi:hypothetical protein